MIPRLILLALLAVLAGPLHADNEYYVYFSSIPSSVSSGQSYYVEATGQTLDGDDCDLSVYKGSNWFAGTSGSDIISAGNSTSDTGPATINYFADGYDYYYWAYDSDSASVTINAPPNDAPTIEWSSAPGSAVVNESFYIQAHGHDANGNLTQVNVWREGSPHAFGDGGNGSDSWSGNNSSGGSTGSVTFSAQAVDSNSATSGTIYHTVTINPIATSFWLNTTSFTYNGGAQGPSIVSSPGGATFTPAGTSATTVGTYYASASAYGNYTGSNGSMAWTINQAGQSINWSQTLTNKVYGDDNFGVSATATSGLPVSFQIIAGSSYASIDAGGVVQITGTGGPVTIRASQAGNAAGSNIYNYSAAAVVDKSFYITAKPITFTLSKSFVYNGVAKTIVPADLTTEPATSGVTFNLTGQTIGTNAGTYTVTATAYGNYSGTQSDLTWEITKIDQPTAVTVASPPVTYGTPSAPPTASGGNSTGAIEWALGSGSTAPGAAIHPSSGDITANGVGTVVIKARRAADTNYNVSAWSSDFSVTVAARAITVTLAGSKTYNGTTTASGASASITTGSLAAGDAVSYTFAATSSANAGSYPGLTTATITNGTAPTTRTGSYNITYVGNYTIAPEAVTAATITPKVFNGSPQSPSAVSSVIPAGATVSVSAPAQTTAGTYTTATVTGTGNFTGTLTSQTWTIDPANQTTAVTVTYPASLTYGDTDNAVASGGNSTGAIEWALGSGSTAPGAAIHPSSGDITANGVGTVVIKARRVADTNYNVSAWSSDFSVSVGARPITVNFSGSKVQDGTTTVTGATATLAVGTLAAGDALSFAFGPTSSASPGTYTGITIPTITNAGTPTTRTASYTVTYTGNYVIRAVITAATIVQRSYTGNPLVPTAVSSTTPANATVTVTAPAQTNASTYYTATVTGTGDFAGTLTNVAWSITPVTQDPVFITSDDTMVFNTADWAATAEGGSGNGPIEWALGTGSTATGAAIHPTSGVVTTTSTGSVFIKAKKNGDGNHPDSAWTEDFEIAITPASQTITFDNPGTQVYGTPLTLEAEASSLLTVTYSIVSGPATVSGSTVNFTAIGDVTVRASQAGNANYNAAPDVEQTFTVNPAPTTFALSSVSFTYDGTEQSTNVVPSPGGATFTTGGTLSATVPEDYTATATATGNYTGTNNSLAWTINKATPGSAFENPRSRGTQTPTTYTVQAADLNAEFSAVGSGTVPTGSVTYSIISATGTGASPTSGEVTAGTTVLTIGTYTLRASYEGNDHYNATTVDAVWNVLLDVDGDGVPGYLETLLGLDPNTNDNQTDGSVQLKIHRPNQ